MSKLPPKPASLAAHPPPLALRHDMRRDETSTWEKQKVSEMILRMAEGFLSMGKDLEHKENLLRFVCTAWNIACFEHSKRHSLLSRYVEQFREANNASEVACKNLEEDMGKLIEEKDRLYPHVIIRITHSKIELVGGKEHVVVTYTPFV